MGMEGVGGEKEFGRDGRRGKNLLEELENGEKRVIQ